MKPGVAKATGMLILAAVGGGSLSACGEEREKKSLTIAPGRDSSQVDSQFGREFGAAFTADPNSEPRNVTEGDLPPVSLTTEPVVID